MACPPRRRRPWPRLRAGPNERRRARPQVYCAQLPPQHGAGNTRASAFAVGNAWSSARAAGARPQQRLRAGVRGREAHVQRGRALQRVEVPAGRAERVVQPVHVQPRRAGRRRRRREGHDCHRRLARKLQLRDLAHAGRELGRGLRAGARGRSRPGSAAPCYGYLAFHKSQPRHTSTASRPLSYALQAPAEALRYVCRAECLPPRR